MSQQRIEVTLAGQKITLATSTEHEPLLRAACILVDEQIQLAINGGNRSIERASMMAALKIALSCKQCLNKQPHQALHLIWIAKRLLGSRMKFIL